MTSQAVRTAWESGSASTTRVCALELADPKLVARAGLIALDAHDALVRIEAGESLRIVALGSGGARSAVIGDAARATARSGLRAAVPPAGAGTPRVAAEVALWVALGARASEVERVEVDLGRGSAIGAIARGRVDLAWTEEDPALVPAGVVPWVAFGAGSGLPSPRGPVVIAARVSALASDRAAVIRALASAVNGSRLADEANAWSHVAARRGWSVERARATSGASLAEATKLTIDPGAVEQLSAYAARVRRLGWLSRAVDVERWCDPRWLARAERVALRGEHDPVRAVAVEATA